MRRLLPVMALFASLVATPVWGEDEPPLEGERAQLVAQGRQLIQQGSVDYERLKQAIAETADERARVSAAGASLGTLDRLAKRAEMLNADVQELHKARSRLEDAKSRLVSGRLDAAKQAFQEAATRWAAVHQRIVTHLGEAPSAPATVFTPPRTDSGGEVASLRKEVQALRAEVQALRAEVQGLKELLQRTPR